MWGRGKIFPRGDDIKRELRSAVNELIRLPSPSRMNLLSLICDAP
jgi:hypothetical protein